MWAFTNRNPQLDLRAATMFAAASHALKGYNDDLAERALTQSKRLMKEATDIIAQRTAARNRQMEEDFSWLDGSENNRMDNQLDKKRQKLMERSRKNREQLGDMATNLQLYGATQEQQYLSNFEKQIWDALELNLAGNMQTALDAVPYMDGAFKQKLRPYVEKYEQYIKGFDTNNPYGVPIGLGNWAGVNMVLNFGITVNVRSRCSTATTVPTSLSSRVMWRQDCSSVSRIILRTTMTGPSFGDKTKALSLVTPSTLSLVLR